jgi:hypothetical protein
LFVRTKKRPPEVLSVANEALESEMTTMGTVLLVAGAILAIGAALYLFDRLLLWMERKGWVYWRKTKRPTGPGVGNALLEIQTLVEPAARHVLELRQEVKEDSTESADPPSNDGGSRLTRP